MWLSWCLLMAIVNFYGIEATVSIGRNLTPSQQKCQEYLTEIKKRQEIRNEQERIKKTYLPKRPWQSWKKNSRSKVIFGIHRGKPTRAMEYPHMGALGWYSLIERDWHFQCGASLISSNFLLTAAHCTKIPERLLDQYDTTDPKIVRLGARNIRKSTYEIKHDFDIDQIKVHEKYMSPNNYYDIALLKLSRQVKFSQFIHPACLGEVPLGKAAKHKKYTVTGWGAIARTGGMVDDLRYGEVDLIDQKKCDFYIYPFRSRNWNKSAPHQICAGKMDGSIDTCNGDSGGPLQYKLDETKDEGTMHVIIGITAFGSTKCATKNLPSVYTKVAYFTSWIERIVWPAETRANYNRNSKKKVFYHPRRHFKNNF